MAKKDDVRKASRRAILWNLANVLKEEAGEPLYKRQVPEETDEFEVYYNKHGILRPPYSFSALYTIYEESDILQSCVEAMQNNVDGFGYQMVFLGDDVKEKNAPQAIKELEKATEFLDNVNEEQSITTARKSVREDLEVLGNGAFEIVRNRKGEIAMMYPVNFSKIRLCRVDKTPVTVTVTVPRGGKLVSIKVKKYFRKFVQISSSGKKLRWFKEFGDPRLMDAETGDFVEEKSSGKRSRRPRVVASELWHLKNSFGGSSYGLPRWIGAVLQVMGRRSAQYVNYDLFDNQGIPPLAIMVSGGVLTDESLEDLQNLVRGMRGVANWNRIAIIESTGESIGLEERGGSAKLELKNLAEYRKEDQMFSKYLDAAKRDVRHRFRLPPLYIGATETFTLATARAAQTIAEEQVFIPERLDFDEKFNKFVIQKELGIRLWKYKTKGPQIVGADERRRGVETFAKTGALTINHAIEQANAAFGLEMSKFDAPWADYPIMIVEGLLKTGRLKGLDDIAEPAIIAAKQQLERKNLLIPSATEKVLKSDMFSETEKEMYKMLVGLQNAIEMINRCDYESSL